LKKIKIQFQKYYKSRNSDTPECVLVLLLSDPF